MKRLREKTEKKDFPFHPEIITLWMMMPYLSGENGWMDIGPSIATLLYREWKVSFSVFLKEYGGMKKWRFTMETTKYEHVGRIMKRMGEQCHFPFNIKRSELIVFSYGDSTDQPKMVETLKGSLHGPSKFFERYIPPFYHQQLNNIKFVFHARGVK